MLVDGGCLFIGIGCLTGFLISARSVLIGGTVILRGRSRLCRGGVLSAAVLGRLGVVGDLAGRVGVGDLPIGGVGDLPIGGVGDLHMGGVGVLSGGVFDTAVVVRAVGFAEVRVGVRLSRLLVRVPGGCLRGRRLIGLLRVGLLRGTVDRLLHAAFGTRGAVSRLLTFSSRRGDAGRIRRCRVSRRW